MKFVLTICAAFFSVSGDGIVKALNDGQPIRACLVRAIPRMLLSQTTSTTGFPSKHVLIDTLSDRIAIAGRYSPPLVADIGGVDSPEAQGIPRPIRIPRRLNILLIAAVFIVTGIAVLLYVGQLVILGWIMDLLTALEEFLSEIGMPKILVKPDPLEYEEVGEIIVVTLRYNIATIRQCQTVQKQLRYLIDEHHCDFVLDFSCADRISKTFRAVMFQFKKSARREAEKLGKPYRSVALPHGKVFRVFDDREHAVEKMSKHDGHGWVVLCSVPVGIRAISDLA